MINLNNLSSLVNGLEDMTKAKESKEAVLLPEGPVKLRFVGYIETGKHNTEWQGQPKVSDKVHLVFELSGGKDGVYNPVSDGKGGLIPHTITVPLSKSLSTKANFFKLFQKMNYAGQATHMVGLLGQAFIGRIRHRKYTLDGKERTALTLRNADDGFSITAPRSENMETGEVAVVEVAKPVSPMQVFIWNSPDKDQWNSIFIDGMYDELREEGTGKVVRPAGPKNKYQMQIMEAINFKGSPAEVLAKGVEIPVASKTSTDDGDDLLGLNL
jgi:hypothetical protein